MEWQGTFTWDGLAGDVRVECVANDDAAEYGCFWPEAVGFPVCTAFVQYPRRGYRAMFGWTQLVRSTDNESRGERFETDPFALFGDTGSPYCWYGTEPVLWDAPSRPTRAAMEWIAHSYLATTPMDELLEPRCVVPLLGFGWGFRVHDDGEVTLGTIDGLGAHHWNADLPVLRAAYPAPRWTFAEATTLPT